MERSQKASKNLLLNDINNSVNEFCLYSEEVDNESRWALPSPFTEKLQESPS